MVWVQKQTLNFDRSISGNQLFCMAEENLLRIDVEKRTTRGRVCPRCEGKIIPSDRAVYQSTGDPDAVFPVWQCEKCGYEEMGERRKPAAKSKH